MQHLKSLEAQRLQQIHAAPSVPQMHHHPPAPTLQLQQQLHHLTPQVHAPVRAATNIPASGTGFQVGVDVNKEKGIRSIHACLFQVWRDLFLGIAPMENRS